MRLYFLRHGQAGDRRDWQGSDDERPLTADGKKRMQQATAVLRQLDLGLDAIVSSPLVRARQTAEVVAAELGLADKLTLDERLAPGFGPAHLAGILRAHHQAGAILLVGHEPDFSQTIGRLIGGGRVAMKKGALACVELADPAALRGELMWLIPPRVLTG